MKAIFIATAIVALASFAYFNWSQSTLTESVDTQKDFFDYIMSFGKKYVDSFEFAKRYDNFRKSLEIIRAHNINLKATYKMGLNQFSDWTQGEIDSFLTLQVEKEERKKNYADLSQKVMKADVDWREKGIINKIKDQGSCGSCWAFSAVGPLESAYAIKNDLKNKEIPLFSEQQIVDCSHEFGSEACDGGWMEGAMEHWKKHTPVLSSEYPYTGVEGTCKEKEIIEKSKSPVKKIEDYYTLERDNNGEEIMFALQEGPISVAIDASSLGF